MTFMLNQPFFKWNGNSFIPLHSAPFLAHGKLFRHDFPCKLTGKNDAIFPVIKKSKILKALSLSKRRRAAKFFLFFFFKTFSFYTHFFV